MKKEHHNGGQEENPPDISSLPLDDQFALLLHKKVMDKTGSAKRRAKKYYIDKYKKTGVIPEPLLLAARGITDGRKCSGRPRVLTDNVKKRFIQMVRASSDPDDPRFIFVTQKARTIRNYHKWLEEEFNTTISISALRRFVKEKGLKAYLRKPDFEDDRIIMTYFNPVPVFDLLQVDGCKFQYLKILDENGHWQKPQVIECFDTGSRYMFLLDFYFSESSANSVDMFTRFLLSTPLPDKKIRFRPDNAKGFLNLKRPIRELNLKYSRPDGFHMEPDFSRVGSPKDKVHLESSHRTLHNFEVRVIKKFEGKIVKLHPGFAFKNGKMRKITVTYLDITIQELRESRMLEMYRREHNEKKHRFSVEGRTKSWVPLERMEGYLAETQTVELQSSHVQTFMQYGFEKKRGSVSKNGTVTYDKQTYSVVLGNEKFSRQKSTTVYISYCAGKLLIFEYRDDGVLLGEALPQKPSEKPKQKEDNGSTHIKPNEIEQIVTFLQEKGMNVNTSYLITRHRKGLTLTVTKEIYRLNKSRYEMYTERLRNSPEKLPVVLFNAFLMDCERYQRRTHVAPYAASKGR